MQGCGGVVWLEVQRWAPLLQAGNGTNAYFTAWLLYHDSVSVNTWRNRQVLCYSQCHVRKEKQTLSSQRSGPGKVHVLGRIERWWMRWNKLVKCVYNRKKLIHKEVPHWWVFSWWQKVTFSVTQVIAGSVSALKQQVLPVVTCPAVSTRLVENWSLLFRFKSIDGPICKLQA